MYFMVAYLVIGISCSIISGRTLVAYTDCSPLFKAAVYILLLYAWFSPILVWTTQAKNILPVWGYTVFAKVSYFLLGFAFLLFMIMLIRDMAWFVVYHIKPLAVVSPDDSDALRKANYITLCATLILSLYAVYEAEKMPQILHYSYADARIVRPMKLLVLSDLHITKMTPVQKVRDWVEYFNSLKPDVILLPGDIADDKVADIQAQLKALKKLQAPLGIYYTLGNHEVYFNALAWESEFATLGWRVLHNSGVEVADTGLYIAGVPDASTLSANAEQALKQAKPDHYRVLLSHIPTVALTLKAKQADLQVSGHTHGGQIFPFNILTGLGNKGLIAGEYQLPATTLLVSRGVGYWGPPMRLGAPSDALLVELNSPQ